MHVRRGGADTEGMLTVETIARIRRDHFKDGKSIKAIARTRGVSRNTVRKVLRRDETAFRYDRQAPTVYPKLGPFQAQLEALLTARLSQSRRERLTLMRMWDLLREAGYAGSYDAVRRYAQQWRRAQGQGGDGLRAVDGELREVSALVLYRLAGFSAPARRVRWGYGLVATGLWLLVRELQGL